MANLQKDAIAGGNRVAADHIDRALVISVLMIERWRDDSLAQTQDAGHDFDGSRPGAEVAKMSFGSGNRRVAKFGADRLGFGLVGSRGAQSASVDVSDVARQKARPLERLPHDSP